MRPSHRNESFTALPRVSKVFPVRVAKTSFDPDDSLSNGSLRFPSCAVRVAPQTKPPQMVKKQ